MKPAKHIENILILEPSDLQKSVFEWKGCKKSLKPEVRTTSMKTYQKLVLK